MGYAKENRRPMILIHPDTLDIEDNITQAKLQRVHNALCKGQQRKKLQNLSLNCRGLPKTTTLNYANAPAVLVLLYSIFQ